MAEYIDRDKLRQAMFQEAFAKDSDLQRWDSGCWIRYKLFENVLEKTEVADVQLMKWIPFSVRDLDEEEQAEHPEWDWILEGELPENGQRILVNVKYRGHEAVQMDEYYNDDGCYLDSGYEIGTEVTHWMPLPEPAKDGET